MSRVRRSSVKKSSVQSALIEAIGVVRETALGSDYPVNKEACRALLNRELVCYKLADAYIEFVDDSVNFHALKGCLELGDIPTEWLFKALCVILPVSDGSKLS
jgi:hypothetical protein